MAAPDLGIMNCVSCGMQKLPEVFHVCKPACLVSRSLRPWGNLRHERRVDVAVRVEAGKKALEVRPAGTGDVVQVESAPEGIELGGNVGLGDGFGDEHHDGEVCLHKSRCLG
jgi:hypothetical protein